MPMEQNREPEINHHVYVIYIYTHLCVCTCLCVCVCVCVYIYIYIYKLFSVRKKEILLFGTVRYG